MPPRSAFHPLALRLSRGTFYFGQLGTSHFGATGSNQEIDSHLAVDRIPAMPETAADYNGSGGCADRSSRESARTPAWRTSPRKQVSVREPCIVTFRRVRTCSWRSIGPRWKTRPRRSGPWRTRSLQLKPWRAWLLLFVDAVETKHIIAPVLNTLVGDPKKVFETSYAQIHEARALVKRAIKSGDIRKDIEPFDLLRALVGVSSVASSPDWQQSAKRLVDILITGSRPIK
jgi:hypothetical protein